MAEMTQLRVTMHNLVNLPSLPSGVEFSVALYGTCQCKSTTIDIDPVKTSFTDEAVTQRSGLPEVTFSNVTSEWCLPVAGRITLKVTMLST